MPTQTFDVSGTWTCPALIFTVDVDAWGSGVDGLPTGGSSGAAGQGGGAYAGDTIAVTPGNTYTVTVDPANGASFSEFTGDSASVIADSANGTSGGTTAASTGAVKFAGGSGGAHASTTGGGGGGSGGSTGAGGNGTAGTSLANGVGGPGGTGSPGGAAGGDGGFHSSGLPGVVPGGGGGGAGDTAGKVGGAGQAGRVILTWVAATQIPGDVAPIVVDAPLGTTSTLITVPGLRSRITVKAFVGTPTIEPEGAPYVPKTPVLTAMVELGPDLRPYIQLTVQGSDNFNILSADDASFETSLGTSTGGGNTTSVAQDSTHALYGSFSMLATFTTAGGECWTNQGPVYPGLPATRYSAMLSVWPTHTETIQTSLNCLAADTSYIGTIQGPLVVCTAGTWTTLPMSGISLAGTAFITTNLHIPSLGTSGETVWVDCVGLFPGTVTTWTPGGLIGDLVAATIIDQHGNYVLGASPTDPLVLTNEFGTIRDYTAPYGLPDSYAAALIIYEATGPISSTLSKPATAVMYQAPDTVTLYNRMGWAQDQDITGVLLVWLAGIGELIQVLDTLVRNTIDEEGVQEPGWSQALDITRAPTYLLPWLGQFVGARVDPTLRDDLQRYLIENAPGMKRGTPAAIIAVVQPFLAHGYSASIAERDTSPYHFTVSVPQFAVNASTCLIVANEYATCADIITNFSVCADLFLIFDEITAAVLAAKPAGLVCVVQYV